VKKKIFFLSFIVIAVLSLNGCLMSKKEYKPLYQVVPEKQSLKPKD